MLTEEEEDVLSKWIIACSKKGFPRRKDDIIQAVKTFLDEVPRNNPFQNNTPGKTWYYAFLRRKPELSLRTAEAVTTASSNVSANDIRKWFTQISAYLKEKGLIDILDDPRRIFNADETNFMFCPKNRKVLAPRGSKNVYTIESQSKTNLTVMFSFRADGKMVPPMIIYPYKRLPKEIIDSVPKGWGIGCSENGWMKSELFYEYIGNVLHPSLVKQKVPFPVILFVDGHSSHLTYKVSKLCSDLQIILIALYPNATGRRVLF